MAIQLEPSDNVILEELGKRLARYRLNQNRTQEQLANEAGIGINTLYRIEQGSSTQLSNLVRLLRALKLTENLDELVPDLPSSPIEQVKLHKKQRRRASSRKKQREKPSNWTWNDKP